MAGEKQMVISGGSYNANDEFVEEGSTVTVWTTKITHTVEKPLITIADVRQPTQMVNQVAPTTKLVDLGRVNEVIAIQGTLYDETTEAAAKKKANLLIIVYHKRAVKITWGTGVRAQTYYGNFSKSETIETAGIIGEQEIGYESEKNFSVQLSFIVGKNV